MSPVEAQRTNAGKLLKGEIAAERATDYQSCYPLLLLGRHVYTCMQGGLTSSSLRMISRRNVDEGGKVTPEIEKGTPKISVLKANRTQTNTQP